MILVDTTIWSLALRRKAGNLSARESSLIDEWRRLATGGQVCLMGPIRQEILSGIRDRAAFEVIRRILLDFPHIVVIDDDYDRAAEFYNTCRSHGIAGSAVDMLICAVAARSETAIFTTDEDFTRYARHLPLRLHGLSTRKDPT